MARESAARNSMREGARRRAEEQTHGGGGFSVNLPDGVKFFQNDGKTVELDFIPFRISSERNPDVLAGRYRVGDLTDGRFYWMHRNIGAEEKPYVCLKSIGQRCPICEAHAAMVKNPRADAEEAKALKAKERVLYNVIDVNDKEGKIMVWDVSYHLFTKLLESDQRDREERYDYADPDNGMTLRIRFDKKSMGKGDPFFEASRIDYDPRKPLDDANLKAAVDLDAALTVLSYEKLEAIFLGVGDIESARVEQSERQPERGRGVEQSEQSRGRDTGAETRNSRRGEAPASVPAAGRRGTAAEDTIHRHAEPKLEPYAGELDEKKTATSACLGKREDGSAGRFGEDEGTLSACNDVCPEDTWKACRDEQDKRKREAKAAAEKPAFTTRASRSGSEDQGRRGRQR